MQYPLFFLILSCFNFFGQVIYAQKDTLMHDEGPIIYVLSDFIKLTDKTEKNITISPLQKSMSLAQILQNQSSFYIKKYGLGGAATISHQGNTASQTELLWEGIPIQNPMLGQTDLNLQALFLVDKVSLQFQDTESLFAGNGLNTSVNLSSKKILQNQYSLLYQIAQFNQHRLGLDLNFVKGSMVSRTRFFFIHAENDFKYKDLNAFGRIKPMVRMPNNSQKQIGLAQDFYYDFTPYAQLSLKFFGQIAARQLPPTLLQSTSDELQKDSTLRVVLAYEKYSIDQSNYFKLSQAFATESILYQNAGVFSYSAYLQSNTLALWKYKINAKNTIQAQGQYQYLKARNESAYLNPPFQNRFSLAALYKYQSAQWMFELASRSDIVQSYKGLYAFSANLTYHLSNKANISVYLARQYRLPTFNDMYWSIGGNLNLKPETSYHSNIAFNYKPIQNSLHQISLGFMPYLSYTQNQLVWLPGTNSALWEAMNLESVKSIGFHANIDYNFKPNPYFIVSLLGQYSFMRVAQELYADKQFFYTPKHNGVVALRLQYKDRIALDYTHQSTSARYIDDLNINFLAPYHIANLSISYIYKRIAQEYHFGLVLNNVYNSNYQIMANRPMPRAWLSFQLQATFLGKKK